MTNTTSLSKEKLSKDIRSVTECPSSLKSKLTLGQAIANHLTKEKASFHMPGHKGRACFSVQKIKDLTELPGLDELASPVGVLHNIEEQASMLWHSRSSFLSVNGASAGLVAAFIAAASTGKANILCPRNSHRSAINGLVFSGLTPVWYEPHWNSNWGFWEGVDLESLEKILKEQANNLSAVLVTSPTYAGAISPVAEIACLCQDYKIPLIVDEAHGTHFLPELNNLQSALSCGADLVVHSLHKTLGAPTQTGLLQAGHNCPFSDALLRDAMNLTHSSSPSYLLLSGIEDSIVSLNEEKHEGNGALKKVFHLAEQLRSALKKRTDLEVYLPDFSDPLHILIRATNLPTKEFYQYLCEQGVYPEAVLGNGVLLLLGVGNNKQDIEILLKTLEMSFLPLSSRVHSEYTDVPRPVFCEQTMSPRQAFLAPSETLPLKQAKGKIAAECFAPCPPGVPVTVPGQIISYQLSEVETSIKSVRVVKKISGGY